jgi:23S rRNA (uracil1939-C5)-methyltransferase
VLLTIEKLIYGGDGLARARAASDARATTVLVPFVLPGEQVEAEIREEKPGFARATATRVVESSLDRIEARCPYFQHCGGCHYQHIPYERQLEFKSEILRETFERVGKIKLPNEIHVHSSPPWNYRNRTRFKVRTAPEFALGYFRLASHEFLPVRECPISSPLINHFIARFAELKGLGCPASIEELELFADTTDEHMLGWAFCGRDARETELLAWGEQIRREFPGLVGLHFFSSRRQMEDDAPDDAKSFGYSGANAISYKTAFGEYQVSAGAFFQVNRNLIDDLISVVTANADGDVALDLYAGGGLFSLPLARSFHHIFAVEASQTSLSDLRQNVPAVVKAVGARTEDYLGSRAVRKRPDLVVMDPPRTGVGKAVTKSLVELGPRQIRYVSCDPATLARDIASLVAAGYRIEEAHMFDLFPQTFHIESVMLLAR